MDPTIPVVDLEDYTSPSRRANFIRTLGEGLERFGFVAVTGHGISQSLLTDAYQVAGELFSLPAEVKHRHETPENGRQRGYTSFGVEHAKDTAVPDLKEFWHIGRILSSDHPLYQEVPPNEYPPELPALRTTFTDLFMQMEDFANRLLVAVAEHLGQPETLFRQMVKDGNSVLRLIHYPPIPEDAPQGAVRSAAHEDVNLMTVLPVASAPGLELMTRDGQWMPVHTPPDVMVCDTGDMMAFLTGGRLPATTHRVANPSNTRTARLSMPFFLHPHPDYVLRPFTGEGTPITARDFLGRRLREIGVL